MPSFNGAVPLGEPRETPPPFSSLSPKDRADLEALAEATGTKPDTQKVEALFLVVITSPGVAIAVQDPDAIKKFTANHPASVPEMQAACHYVEQRIHDSLLSQAMVTTQLQAQAALARQAQDAKLARDLNLN